MRWPLEYQPKGLAARFFVLPHVLPSSCDTATVSGVRFPASSSAIAAWLFQTIRRSWEPVTLAMEAGEHGETMPEACGGPQDSPASLE